MDPADGAIAALILIPAALIYPLARLRNARVRWWIGSVVCCVPLLLPLVRDPELVRRRWGMALLGLLLWGRGLEYLRRRPSPASRHGGPGAYVVFMLLWPNTMVFSRFLLPLEAPRFRFFATRVALGTGRIALCAGLMAFGQHLRLHEVSFSLDHLFKLVEIYLLINGLSNLTVAVFSLTGRRPDEIFRNLLTTPSVLHFWTRYNLMVHYWMREHIFDRVMPAKGFGAAIFATFMFSGMFHEYLFTAAGAGIPGTQLAFWLMQAPIGYLQWKARQRWPLSRPVWCIITLILIYATTPLFFIGVDDVFRFHEGTWVLRVLTGG